MLNDSYNNASVDKLLNEQEQNALNSFSYCENQNHPLMIAKLEHSDQFIVYHCEYKSNEYVYKWSMDDIFNMSGEEFVDKLYKGYKTTPLNHDSKVYDMCKATVNICKKPGELNKVCVNTSTLCNIKCKFCNIKELKPILPREKELYFDILYKLKNSKLMEIQLTGDGEPFVYKKDTLEYIDNLTTNDCKQLVIFTNVTLLDEEDIIRMHNASVKSGVKIFIMCSCSAITPETYSIVHGNTNFEKVVNNIKLINEFDMLQNVNFVILPDNLQELEFYKQFWKEKNVTKVSATVVHDYCYPGATKFVYDSAEYKRFIENS